MFTILFLIYWPRYAYFTTAYFTIFDTTHPFILNTSPPHLDLHCPSYSLILQFCLLICFEWAINHLLPHDKVQDKHILPMINLFSFGNYTSRDMWHSATPSTLPLSILFSQSLIAVVNSFWTRHQSCFNSFFCVVWLDIAHFHVEGSFDRKSKKCGIWHLTAPKNGKGGTCPQKCAQGTHDPTQGSVSREVLPQHCFLINA